MKSFRFSLRSMLLGVAAVSLACAALVKPNGLWALAFQAASLGMLTLALLAVLVYERSAARAFWIGFAVVGWGYLGLLRFPLADVSLTDLVSESLMDAIHPSPPSSAAPPLIDPAAGLPPSVAVVENARNAFRYLVVWIWPLLLGFVGGVVAQQLYLRRERLAAGQAPRGSGAS